MILKFTQQLCLFFDLFVCNCIDIIPDCVSNGKLLLFNIYLTYNLLF